MRKKWLPTCRYCCGETDFRECGDDIARMYKAFWFQTSVLKIREKNSKTAYSTNKTRVYVSILEKQSTS